jgi:hypothetical protein
MPDQPLAPPPQGDELPGCCLGFAIGCLALPVLSIVMIVLGKLAELAAN